jgi:hypothetical protein
MDMLPATHCRKVLPIDYLLLLCHTATMSRTSRKFIAVLMLTWLPIFTGSALAASVSMQMQQGECHEADAMQTMDHMNMDEHTMMHHGDMPAPADAHSPSCSACGVCHLACTGYLAVPGIDLAPVQAGVREITPYLVIFQSRTSAPLVPPPLVRA